MNVDNSHWFCAVIFMNEKRIEYFDSCAKKPKKYRKYTKHLKRYIRYAWRQLNNVELQNADKWEIRCHSREQIPQQDNGYDCGIFTCMYAYYFAYNQELRFTQSNIHDFRSRILLSIIKGVAIDMLVVKNPTSSTNTCIDKPTEQQTCITNTRIGKPTEQQKPEYIEITEETKTPQEEEQQISYIDEQVDFSSDSITSKTLNNEQSPFTPTTAIVQTIVSPSSPKNDTTDPCENTISDDIVYNDNVTAHTTLITPKTKKKPKRIKKKKRKAHMAWSAYLVSLFSPIHAHKSGNTMNRDSLYYIKSVAQQSMILALGLGIHYYMSSSRENEKKDECKHPIMSKIRNILDHLHTNINSKETTTMSPFKKQKRFDTRESSLSQMKQFQHNAFMNRTVYTYSTDSVTQYNYTKTYPSNNKFSNKTEEKHVYKNQDAIHNDIENDTTSNVEGMIIESSPNQCIKYDDCDDYIHTSSDDEIKHEPMSSSKKNYVNLNYKNQDAIQYDLFIGNDTKYNKEEMIELEPMIDPIDMFNDEIEIETVLDYLSIYQETTIENKSFDDEQEVKTSSNVGSNQFPGVQAVPVIQNKCFDVQEVPVFQPCLLGGVSTKTSSKVGSNLCSGGNDRILSSYEKKRLIKIQRNKEYLSKLGLGSNIVVDCLRTETKVVRKTKQKVLLKRKQQPKRKCKMFTADPISIKANSMCADNLTSRKTRKLENTLTIENRNQKQKKRKYTKEEKDAIKEGYNRYSGSNYQIWSTIQKNYPILNTRTTVNIKDCHRTMKKRCEI